MSHESATIDATAGGRVPAGMLAPWNTGDLPPAPAPGWRLWIGLLGPGVVLAGTSIGSGEWLFGPAVSAQYGATLLWLASISIILQVFCNLMMMRYAIYCGEPIIVGGLRTRPGPKLWVWVYGFLDIAAIWPYNASNAAVPLAAALLTRLPGSEDRGLVQGLGFTIFILSFVPLVFGGTVYRMLEKIMTAKLILVLGYLTFIALFMVSGRTALEVATGFFRFGAIPQRADSLITGPHFNVGQDHAGGRYVVKGTLENTGLPSGNFVIIDGDTGRKAEYPLGGELPDSVPNRAAAQQVRDVMLRSTLAKIQPERFYLQTHEGPLTLEASGRIVDYHDWQPEELFISEGPDQPLTGYGSLADVPPPYQERFAKYMSGQGIDQQNLFGYVARERKLPPLDWGTIVAFVAIAGAGGLTNTLFSNYARDKGWGMGAKVGAIPSAVGGRTITLSHVGEVFPLSESNLSRWRGWIRHIMRDQGVWMVASFLGMALPCMMSLEFIRNATVTGDRVAAMSAEGIAARYPQYGQVFWGLTLLCGFLVLAPGQVSIGDQIARRWTDIIWTANRRAQRLDDHKVKYVYYTILGIYAVWGLIILSFVPAYKIAKIGAVLGNIALGFSALHAWYANRVLLPYELRPNWLLQLGVLTCGLFFLGISVVVFITL